MERYRYWASFQVTRLFHSATNLSARPISRLKSFSFFYFLFYLFIILLFFYYHYYYYYLFIYLFIYFFLGGGRAQLQCIYYLVLYTDLKAAESN